MAKPKYKCGKCNRYILLEKRMATDEQIKEQDCPSEYYVPTCKKCGTLNGYEIEIERVK